uniref:Uncharacterized protein n=2 Tax=Picea TaxID=3328 RepID=A0A101M5P0_PICGL|nr:hypothetical protein ABT39_MTgene1296 [Picea glauca]QHR91623.1 hypothetical protein Q903MT_gene5658 [Picea sitchensis]
MGVELEKSKPEESFQKEVWRVYRQSCHEISKKVEQCEAQLDLLKMQKQQQEHGQLAGSSMEFDYASYASQLKVAKQNWSLLPSTDSILQAPSKHGFHTPSTLG